MKRKYALLMTFLLGISFLHMAVHTGKTYSVEINPLQALVDVASPGQNLLISPGIYRGTLLVNKSINLIGLDRDITILEGTSDWDDVFLASSNIHVSHITFRNFWLGLHVGDCPLQLGCANVTIDDCVFVSCATPIHFFNVTDSVISNCQFIRGTQADCRISIGWSTRVEISNNNLSIAHIYLNQFNKHCLITGNYITGNNESYHPVPGDFTALIIQDSYNNTITRNTFAYNKIGIHDTYKTDCGNPIPNMSYNLFYLNNFIENNNQVQFAFDVNDFWDNGTHGNYWSDYTGIDTNADGIGDTPYTLNLQNVDNKPLMTDPMFEDPPPEPPNQPPTPQERCLEAYYHGLIVTVVTINITNPQGHETIHAIKIVN